MTASPRKSGTYQRNFRRQLEVFNQAVEEGSARAKKLIAGDIEDGGESRQVEELTEELRIHQEELSVAQEELRAQIEELGQGRVRLLGERERYRQLFEGMPVAVFLTDLQGVVCEANAASGALLRTDPSYLRGKPLAAFVGLDGRFDFRNAVTRAGVGETVDIEVTMRGRRGHSPVAQLRGTLGADATRLLFVAQPAASESESEAKASLLSPPSDLRKALARAAELERALLEKEGLLVQAQTRHSKLAAENRAKDRSLAIVSHELRAPIQAVLGWTHLLRSSDLTVEVRERGLRVIERNCRAQASLIESLFDLSRVAAGKLSIHRQAIDLERLVAFSVETHLQAAKSAGLTIECDLERDILIIGDHDRMQQVLTNLLTNAFRHSHPGGTVRVTLRDTGVHAELVVADEGEGIEPVRLDQVFECFEQGSTESGGGLGLGLYLVRGIVSMHHGKIRAESEGPGKGARFVIELPTAARAE